MELEEENEDIEYWEKIIPYISEHLDWREFLLHCDFLSYEEKKQFKDLGDEKVSSSEIVQKILYCFLQKSNVRNKRQKMGDILEQMDNGKICKLLQRKRLPTKSENKKKINGKMHFICLQLRVEEILLYLKYKEVINGADIDVIRAKLAAEGNWVAAFELMFRLSRRETHWFGKFIEALIETDQIQLAKQIDNDLCQKIELDIPEAFREDNPSCITSAERRAFREDNPPCDPSDEI